MKNEPIIVRNRRDLDLLLRQHVVALVPRNGRQIRLEVPGLNGNEKANWERKISRIYHSCGCGEGALSVLVGTPLILGYFFLLSNRHSLFFYLFVFLTSLLLLAIGGKVLGITLAKIRLRHNISVLDSLIEHAREAEGTDPGTG